MRSVIVAAAAALALGGCVAVPAAYPVDAYYYPAPTVGVGIYSAPGFYHPQRHHRHHRHRGHRHHRH